MTVALITGIAGQDGSYLAELLLKQGYEVHGLLRSSPRDSRLRNVRLQDKVTLHHGDLADQQSLVRLIERIGPHEIYNLAAESFVPASWQDPVANANVNALGVARLLETIRTAAPQTRLFQAGTSEMFGAVSTEPQNEQTPFNPRTPYAVAKAYAHWLCVSYRERYGIFAACGILFNHESPLRGPQFLSRKVAQGAVAIKRGKSEKLHLGNLEGRRDWGFAGDFVRAMWLMLQQPQPDDYVIASGASHAVREWVELAFSHVGLNWQEHVQIDPELVRPAEKFVRRGDASKARQVLGWQPLVGFEELVKLMVDAELVGG